MNLIYLAVQCVCITCNRKNVSDGQPDPFDMPRFGMLTVLLIIFFSMMFFSTLVVILASIAASRSSRWEEEYWEELASYDSKQEKFVVSEPVYQEVSEEADEAEGMIKETEQEISMVEKKPAEHPRSKTPPSSSNNPPLNTQPRSA